MLAKLPRRGLSTLALVAASLCAHAPAWAQGVPQRPGGPLPQVSQPVVQTIRGSDGMALDAALGRLARDPRDIAALIDAGNAALAMGDVEAATGFFRRADQVSPGNPRVKAGLAGAMVRSGDPFDAIPLFEEAEKAGVLDGTLAADRGLAYDLVGDNATAQRYYRQSMARMPSEEATRRLTLSYAIAGDKHNAETTISPLLGQRNLSAWRTRVFSLAILGQSEEAVSTANTILPAELAGAVAPYLRYMPRLTKAQQAAAANFGAFPRASEIGRDDPRVALFAPKGAVAAVDQALVPKGEPLGRKERRQRERDQRERARAERLARASAPAALASKPSARTARAERVAPPEPPQPARGATAAMAAAPSQAAAVPARPTPPTTVAEPAPIPMLLLPASPPSVAAASPVPVPVPAPAPTPTPTPSSPPAPSPPTAPSAAASNMLAVAPGFSISPGASAPVPAPAAASVSAPLPEPPLPRSLADAFAEFDRPSTDATPASGAVDLRGLKPTRSEARKPAAELPPAPSHPSRIWVQLGTGREKAALNADWRRLTRDKAEIFRGKDSSVSAWGQSRRLLTGPFPTEAAANAFLAQLRRGGVNGAHVWTSPAGQVVDDLAAAPAAAEARPASSRASSSRASSSRPAASRQEAGRASTSRSATTRSGATRQEAGRASTSRSATTRSGAARQEAGRSSTSRSATSRSGASRSESSRTEAAKPAAARVNRGKAAASRTETTRAESSRSERTRSTSTRTNTSRSATPKREASKPASSRRQ